MLELRNGVFQVFQDAEQAHQAKPLYPVPTYLAYCEDLGRMMYITSHGPAKSACFHRLELLEGNLVLQSHLISFESFQNSTLQIASNVE